MRHIGQTGSSSDAAGQRVGEGTHGHHGGYVGQQGAMYGQHMNYSYDPNWVPPSPTPIMSIEELLIE